LQQRGFTGLPRPEEQADLVLRGLGLQYAFKQSWITDHDMYNIPDNLHVNTDLFLFLSVCVDLITGFTVFMYPEVKDKTIKSHPVNLATPLRVRIAHYHLLFSELSDWPLHSG
jgi:hypothetical protein